jgi:opacity protein-like surface antigen
MRRWVVAAILAGIAHGAQAADLPDLNDLPVLRGPYTDGLSQTTVNWQGAYVGGQFGYSTGNMDFSKATKSLTDFALQNLIYKDLVGQWTVLGQSGPTSLSFGGFVGYNAQWDDVILGIEANYSRFSNMNGTSSNTLPRINIPTGCLVPPPGEVDACGIQVSATAAAKITDMMTLRGRAGWAVDNFMPYMFGGLALGWADISRTVSINENNQFFDSTTSAFISSVQTVRAQSEASKGVFTYGYTAGLGLEAMLYGNMFGRAEYEYVKFNTTRNIDIHLNTVRAALGYKF